MTTHEHPSVTNAKAFRAVMMQIADLAKVAAAMDVQDHWKAQAGTVEKLAGIKLARIVGEADANDALRMADDLRDIGKAVDPLVEAFGSVARENFNGIDRKMFETVLSDAIDGMALHEIEHAARELASLQQAAE